VSVELTVYVTTAPPALVATTVGAGLGVLIVGAGSAVTLTVNVPVAWLLNGSVPVQLTVVVPTRNVVGDGAGPAGVGPAVTVHVGVVTGP
jgi:hypothetical protein